MKCLICKKGVAINECCMNMKVDYKLYQIHMGCEHEWTELRSSILLILADWNGLWKKYEKLIDALKEKYSIAATKKEAKSALQFLVKTGEVMYGPLIDWDYIPCGSGYTWIHGEGIC